MYRSSSLHYTSLFRQHAPTSAPSRLLLLHRPGTVLRWHSGRAGLSRTQRLRAAHRRLDDVLTLVEAPSRYAIEVGRQFLQMGIALTIQAVSLAVAAYRTRLHPRLRRAIRFLIGVPFFFGTVFLVCMHRWFWTPPRPRATVVLDTSCVRGLPLCESVEELLLLALQLRSRYGSLLDTEESSAGRRVLTDPAAQNAVLRDVYVLLRSIEVNLMDTPLERELVEPSLHFARGGSGGMTNVSPAEFTLRVLLSISLEQGWSDIIESCRMLFRLLVRNHPVPPQANVVQYVADLCQLSYELTSHLDITPQRRRAIANAIDGFRPERAVAERFTIPSEVRAVSIADRDLATRCVVLTRHSPGRKPQLILSFVGSTSLSNWVTNVWFFRTPLPACYGVGGGALAHRGFLHLLESVNYLEVAEPYDQILLVGHSLGGALAQLAGLRLAAERPSRRITVVSMASPRVLAYPTTWPATVLRWLRGAEGEGEGELTLPPNFMHLRGFIRSDAVPQLPPEFLHFTHIGRPIPLETGCRSFTSFVLWGMWSYLFHSSDFYRRALEDPTVSQTHVFTPTTWEDRQSILAAAEEDSHSPLDDHSLGENIASMMVPFRF